MLKTNAETAENCCWKCEKLLEVPMQNCLVADAEVLIAVENAEWWRVLRCIITYKPIIAALTS